ncbi:hypothetical protein L3X38_015708 [Prunus dulcis]|uniref:Glucose-methanol-choline oxidoreductase C-terminal domain-containing protein n=1 Tax=Prunus dulcis TaxID=3755 RepID=A0AAD4Z8G2_PRUDU|nr:hypothetical protein L3X38_015708 [Prunus dulcis]
MGKKTKKPGKGKEKAAKAEEKRARRETRSSHLRMTSMPFWVIDGSTFYHTPAGANPQATVIMLGRYMGQRILHDRLVHGSKMKN